MKLPNGEGDVIDQRELDGSWNIWARFMSYLEVSPPAPPGTHTVSITCDQERLEWRRATTVTNFLQMTIIFWALLQLGYNKKLEA